IVQARPDMTSAYLGLGTTYWKTGSYFEATPLIERALAMTPNDPDANWIYSDLLARAGDYRKAKEYAAKALAGNPELIEAHGVLGKAYLSENKPELAIAELQKAVPADTDGRYYYTLQRALAMVGRDAEAASALETFKAHSRAYRKQQSVLHGES